MKRFISIITLILCVIYTMAQIQVKAPNQVAVGEQFRLQYVVGTQDVKNFRSGNIPDAFEVLTGPYTSTQQSFSIVNGQVSQSSSITYTYVLCANKQGSFTIPGAHAKVAGKDETSPSCKIKVAGSVQQQGGNGSRQQQQRQNAQQVRPRGSAISGNDLYITVTANKKQVYEQEPILLTYKVYAQVELTALDGKMPDLNGFHTQEVPLPQQKSFHMETVNGKPYRAVTWSQYVMYPQMTGKLEIPSITFKGIVLQSNPNVDPFEAFFNGGSSYVEVKKDIVAPGMTIQVNPLPAKPADFSGGVGKFTISSSLDKKSVKAGTPANVHIVISGTGNLKLVKQPELVLPKDIDKYDPKVTDKTKLTANGLTGDMIYDILIVPGHQGKYTIAPLELTYFDTTERAYKTVKTQPLELDVLPGDGKGGNVDSYANRADNDIKPIHEAPSDISTSDEHFFGSTAYTIINAVVFLIFLALVIIFRERAIKNSNVAGMRLRKANSVANKRLKKAAKFMKDNKPAEFYDEVMRAIWGYVSDKFAIPVADLSRDTATDSLTQRNVDQTLIDTLLEAIDECEFERYAPGDASGNMQKTYDAAVSAITNIEDVMKQTKKTSTKKAYTDSYLHGIIVVLMLGFASLCNAAPAKAPSLDDLKTAGDVAYDKGNYQEAISKYTQILKTGRSADVYYNLGNAYYRTRNLTQAIISYERALLLSPGNEDIQHNLKIARSKTIDQLLPSERMFFAEWYLWLRNLYGIDTLAYMALASLILSLLCFLVYLFVGQPVVQRLSFYASVVLIVVFVFSNIFAYQQNKDAKDSHGAIIIVNTVTLKKTPNAQSADACVVHEGTHVDITDDSLKGWVNVSLPDGREGWLAPSAIEVI